MYYVWALKYIIFDWWCYEELKRWFYVLDMADSVSGGAWNHFDDINSIKCNLSFRWGEGL